MTDQQKDNLIQVAARYTVKQLLQKNAKAVLEVYGDKENFYQTVLFYSRKKYDENVNEDFGESAIVNYLITGIKSYIRSDCNSYFGRSVEAVSFEDLPATIEELGYNDTFKADVDKRVDTETELALIERRLSYHDSINGTEYLDRFHKLQAVGFSESKASEKYGYSRQAWNAAKNQIILIARGETTKQRKDRLAKL